MRDRLMVAPRLREAWIVLTQLRLRQGLSVRSIPEVGRHLALLNTPADGSGYPPRLPVNVDIPARQPSATCGIMHRSKTSLFDHLVGAGEQHRRHLEAEGVRRLEINHHLVLGRRLHG